MGREGSREGIKSVSEASKIYHQDFHAWAMRNAELVRQGRLAEIDAEHVAEELESMGKSQQRALGSRLTVLLAHLLILLCQIHLFEFYK